MRNTIEEAATRYADNKIEKDYGISSEAFIEAGCRFGYNDVVQAYEAGSDFALTHQWRSVDDEQPKQCETVLCVNANADPHCKWCWLSFYVGDIFQDNADSKATFPTHWLRIPEFPSPNPALKTKQR